MLLVTARQTSARLGMEKTPLRLLLRNRENVFRSFRDSTVLSWGKYDTVSISETGCLKLSGLHDFL
jgi:hypothetical protein